MATNWTVQTSSKASTTDNFTVENLTKAFNVANWQWDSKSEAWESIIDMWNFVGKDITWTISNKAVTKDSD